MLFLSHAVLFGPLICTGTGKLLVKYAVVFFSLYRQGETISKTKNYNVWFTPFDREGKAINTLLYRQEKTVYENTLLLYCIAWNRKGY